MNVRSTMEATEAANVSVMTTPLPIASPLGGTSKGTGTKDRRLTGVPDLILESSNSSSGSSHDHAPKSTKLPDKRSGVTKTFKECDAPEDNSAVTPASSRGRSTTARSKKVRPSSKPNEFLPLRMDQQLRSKSMGRMPRRNKDTTHAMELPKDGEEEESGLTNTPTMTSNSSRNNNVLDRANALNHAAENAWLDSAANSARSKSHPPKPRHSKAAVVEEDEPSEGNEGKSTGTVKIKVKAETGNNPEVIKIVKKCSPTTQPTNETTETPSNETPNVSEAPVATVETGDLYLSPVKAAKQSLNGSGLVTTSPMKSPTIRVNLKPPEFLPLRSNLNRIPSYKNPKAALGPTIDLESDDEEESEHPTELLPASTECHRAVSYVTTPEASALDAPASPVKASSQPGSIATLTSPIRSPSKSPKSRVSLKSNDCQSLRNNANFKAPVTPAAASQGRTAMDSNVSSAVPAVNLEDEHLPKSPKPNSAAVVKDSEESESPISPRRMLRATKGVSLDDKKPIEWEKPNWAKAKKTAATEGPATDASSTVELMDPSSETNTASEVLLNGTPRAEEHQRPQTVRGMSFDSETQPFGDSPRRAGKRTEGINQQDGDDEPDVEAETIPQSPSKNIRPTTVRGLSFEMKPEEAAQLPCRRGGKRASKEGSEGDLGAQADAPPTPVKAKPAEVSKNSQVAEPATPSKGTGQAQKSPKPASKTKKAAKAKTQPSKEPDASVEVASSSQAEAPPPIITIPQQSEPVEEIKEAPRVCPEYALRPGLVRGMSFDEDAPVAADVVKARGGRKPRVAAKEGERDSQDIEAQSDADETILNSVDSADDDLEGIKEAPRPEFSLRPGLVRGMSFDEDTPAEAVPAARPRSGRKPRPNLESTAKPNLVAAEMAITPLSTEDITSDGVLKPVPAKALVNTLAESEREPEWTKPKLKSASKNDPTEKEKQIAWSKPAWVVNRNMALQQQHPDMEGCETAESGAAEAPVCLEVAE